MLSLLAWARPAFCGPIHDAARKGDVTKVKALLKGDPCLVSSKDKWGATPLDYAAMKGYGDVTRLLLAYKADVNAKDILGMTALHEAAYYDHKDEAALPKEP